MSVEDGITVAGNTLRSERRGAAAALLFAALVCPLVLPFLGVPISLLTLALSPALGPRVWPGVGRARSASYAALALLAFWVAPIASTAGADLASGWLLIPLCGPADAFAWLVPAGVGIAVYAAVCILSVRLRRPMLWVAAAALAMAVYEGAWAVLEATGDRWVC